MGVESVQLNKQSSTQSGFPIYNFKSHKQLKTANVKSDYLSLESRPQKTLNYASDTNTEANVVSNDIKKVFLQFVKTNFEHFLALKVDFTQKVYNN